MSITICKSGNSILHPISRREGVNWIKVAQDRVVGKTTVNFAESKKGQPTHSFSQLTDLSHLISKCVFSKEVRRRFIKIRQLFRSYLEGKKYGHDAIRLYFLINKKCKLEIGPDDIYKNNRSSAYPGSVLKLIDALKSGITTHLS
jgi:hypothetical protein